MSCRGRNEAAEAADRERFMEELEEDADLRARINLYKDSTAAAAAATAGNKAVHSSMVGSEDDDDDELPQIPLDELLDELQGLAIDEGDDEEYEDEEDEHMSDGA